MKLSTGMCLVLFTGQALGCATPVPPSFQFDLRVESDADVPLADVRLLRAGVVVAQSGADGKIDLTLAGSAGESVPLEVQCPAGFRAPEKPLLVMLRKLSKGAQRPEYRLACKPELRSLVVAVRADNGRNLPVRYLGRELARTDEQGAAHVLLKAVPGDNLTLELDTNNPAARELSPQNPRFELTMPDHDELALFDQRFTRPPIKKKRIAQPTGPIAIVRH